MQYLTSGAILVIFLFGAEQLGEHRIQKEWDLEKARLAAIAEQSKIQDASTIKTIKAQYEKDLKNAESQAGKRAIADYLRTHGLLSSGPKVPSSCDNQAKNSSGTNETSSQSGTSQHLEEFAKGCALDALEILRWQEWAIRENLEVE